MTASFSSRPTVAFRTDASLEIGTGHVMRCLTLADALRLRGANCLFLCRPHKGHLTDHILTRGHRVVCLRARDAAIQNAAGDPPHGNWLGVHWQTDAEDSRQALSGHMVDWLVVDHYALDHRWEQALRPSCRRLMVMDDLADRGHDCDLLLDPSLGRERSDYENRISDATIALLGPKYALLRPEFAALRSDSLARRKEGAFRHLLVTMGGVDKDDVTGRFLRKLNTFALPPYLRITVVLGSHAPWLDRVRAQAQEMQIVTAIRIDVRDMASLMRDSDLAVGGGGGTSWERCCLGLPTLVMCLADNQYEMAKALQDEGAAIATQGPAETAQCLATCYKSGRMEAFLIDSSIAAARVTDGCGADRVCQRMFA